MNDFWSTEVLIEYFKAARNFIKTTMAHRIMDYKNKEEIEAEKIYKRLIRKEKQK